jgi:hypothetical protein
VETYSYRRSLERLLELNLSLCVMLNLRLFTRPASPRLISLNSITRPQAQASFEPASGAAIGLSNVCRTRAAFGSILSLV